MVAHLFQNVTMRQLRGLVAHLERSGVQKIEIYGSEFQLRVVTAIERKGVPLAMVQPMVSIHVGSENSTRRTIVADEVGIFLRRHPSRLGPLAMEGQKIRAGEVVGLLRIGQIYRSIISTEDGQVEAFLAADGSVVGYGQALISLTP